MFEPIVLEHMKNEILNAPYGAKGIILKKWAKHFNVTPQHLYRLINRKNSKRPSQRSCRKQEYYQWAEDIFRVKKSPPEEAGELSTEDAVAIAVKAGMVPEAALDVPVSTFNAIARKKIWNKTSARAVRFQAGHPNEAHHFDASTSKFFYIDRRDGDDYILKLHRPAMNYKNKPIPIGMRLWIYGVVDDYSGRLLCRYVAATGETSIDSMEFLSWAWSKIGLPKRLFADQGMLKKSLPSQDLIERLGIELPQAMPYQKRAHGKIERPWRTVWQKFEKLFFATEDYKKFEITLSELNQHLENFIEDKYNQLPHRYEKTITRQQAWNKINLYGGIVKIPQNILATVARRVKRKVGIDGTINYQGKTYEVKGLYDAWVWVYEGIFDDRLIVQDIETGQKYEVRDFKPLPLGEYRAFSETPHQKLIKEPLPISQPVFLYGEKKTAR